MLKDITLGQFFPGKTIIHRLDPRTKILLMLIYFVTLFLAKNYFSYALVLSFLVGATLLGRIPFRAMTRGLKPMLIIIVFTGVLNLFYTRGGTLLLEWKFIHIYSEGLRTAFFMILRILMLVCGTFLLTYTTSPIALTDALEQLASPLKKLHVPVHEFSMMMCIALRFIPTLIEETDKIISAQKARGADFETGNLIRRAKALIPILVPLFFSAFRRADELATAMECRCYHGGEGRTSLKVLRYALRDYLALSVGLVLLVLVAILRHYGL
ncbi:MAG: energy-coupling factor transporter transmembrane protein EcfT [Oscillospiraceae bacterium]|nr:energy-coupling factor transporter transmembrane protein EcfT [Oscillospiraceae bacterium]